MSKAAKILDAVEPLSLQERIERDKTLRSTKSELHHWKSRAEEFEKELAVANARNDYLDELKSHEILDETIKRLKPSGKSTAVCVWSDWHLEEKVDPKTVNNLNEYDLSIAEKRVKRMFERTLMMLDVARSLTTITGMVVAIIGDLITGYIHPELVENNHLSPTEATLMAMDLIVPGLRSLKRQSGLKSIIVPTCWGNHGRTTEKKRISSGYANSYEWWMFEVMSRIMNDPKKDAGITWKVGRSYHNLLSIQDRAVRFHHGDALKYSGGIGGWTVPVEKAVKSWNNTQHADIDYFGHIHTFLNHRRWVSNGSVIGYGPYSIEIKAEYEEPSQTLSIINHERGKIFTDRIFCD